MTADSDQGVAIVGAGLAGALLACLLADTDREIDVYDYRPDPREHGFAGGRSINLALSARGIHALRRAGLAERVLADAITMPGRMIHSPAGRLSFQPYSKNTDDAINSVSRGQLNVTLLEAADRRENVRLHFCRRCVDVDLDAPSVLLRDPDGATRSAEAGLVIGCDGAFSAVRGRLERLDRFDYSQRYLEHGYKELTIPPRDGGFALEAHALHIWPRGRSMMIALPNRDRSFTATLFWPFSGPGSFEEVQGDDVVRSFFEANFPDAVPLMPDLSTEYRDNPVGSLVTVRCGPWFHRDRAVLVGDAAHAIVPFYGQGMNAAFEDCVVLADCLREQSGDVEPALREYFEARKPNAEAIADLALHNFIEMRDLVASPVFRLKKTTERVLHTLLPRWYVPLYNLVTFTRVPYAEARRRAARQGRVVAAVAWTIVIVLMLLVASVLLGAPW